MPTSGGLSAGLFHDVEKDPVIAVRLKQLCPPDSAIEYVVDIAASSVSRASGHDRRGRESFSSRDHRETLVAD